MYNTIGDKMKNFKKLDEQFICQNCKKQVNKLNYTSRDHCNYCLHSIHIDIKPGDRLNTCLGLLKPIDIEKYKDSLKIIYKCQKCQEIHKNIIAIDDDYEQIIKLSSKI